MARHLNTRKSCNYWLLVVESQIANLTFGPSFGHNLWFNYPIGHASPFKTSKFQELSNDIRKFLIQWLLTLVIAFWNGNSLGSVGVHSFTFSHIFGNMKCDSRASLLARTFASPCLGCEPKTRVATWAIIKTIGNKVVIVKIEHLHLDRQGNKGKKTWIFKILAFGNGHVWWKCVWWF